jgi:hypothetical protein
VIQLTVDAYMTSVEENIINLIGRLSERLSAEIAEECVSLARHGEWGIALENLCVQLSEHDIFPSTEELGEIQRLAKCMKLNDQVWSFLIPPVA